MDDKDQIAAFTSFSSSSANAIIPVTFRDSGWLSSNTFLIAFDNVLAPCWTKGLVFQCHREMQVSPLSAGMECDPLRWN